MTGAHGDVDIWIRPTPFRMGCAVGLLPNGSVAVKIDGEGNEVAVAEVGQVLVKHFRIPLHDVIDVKVATALRQRLYGG